MKPKQKSSLPFWIYGTFLVVVVYVCLHGAVAYEEMISLLESRQIESREQIFTVLNLLTERINYYPTEFIVNNYTKQWLLIGCFGWFIVVAGIENGKKNYIHGKEFGTARWGGLSDISDLFADNILKKEIAKIKKARFVFGRWMQKRKAFEECVKNSNAIKRERLNILEEREWERKENGTSNKKLYNEEKKRIIEEEKENLLVSRRIAWQPEQFKYELKLGIDETKKSVLFDSAEKRSKIKELRAEYKKKIKAFNKQSISSKIHKVKKKYENADMILTQTEKISFHNFKVNRNTLIIGGSGSGKTRGYIAPNILQASTSYVITDPKGEVLEKTGTFLKMKGYKLKVLNLGDDKQSSDGYNPFMYIHPERAGYEERVLSLIETFIMNTDGGEKQNSSDPFWPKAERLFLQAIFFFVVDGFSEEERNMKTVMRLISMLEIGEEEDNKDSDLDYFVKIFARKHGEEHIGVQQYYEFRGKASGKTAKSIVISAVARLAPFRTPEIQRIMSYDEMELDRIGEEKVAIFVVVAPSDDTFAGVAGMAFTQLFQEIQYCATQVHKHDGCCCPVPVRFLMDEFATTCKVPNFVKILAYARSLGVGITIVLQSLEQIKKDYKDDWGVIVDNCNSLLFLGNVTHPDTLDYMSKLIGKGTFDKRTTGRTRGRQGSSSENFDVVGRELMLPSDLREMPHTDCILVVGGRPAFYSKKFKYDTHPNYIFTSDGNRANSYEHIPLENPYLVSHREKSRVEEERARLEDAVKKEAREVVADANNKAEIKVLNDAENLKEMTQSFNGFIPLDDDLFAVNDGEDAFDLDDCMDALFGTLNNVEEEVNAMTLQILDEVEEEVLAESPKIINAKDNLHLFGRTWRELEWLSDDVIKVNDGEEITDEEAQEVLDEWMGNEYIEDEDANNDEFSELSDNMVEDTFGDELDNLLSQLADDAEILDTM